MHSKYHLLVGLFFGVGLIMPLKLSVDIFLFSVIAIIVGATLPDYDLEESVTPFIERIATNMVNVLRDQVYDRMINRTGLFGHRELTHTIQGLLYSTLIIIPIVLISTIGAYILFPIVSGLGEILAKIFFPILLETHFFEESVRGWNSFIQMCVYGLYGFYFGLFTHIWLDSTTIQGITLFPRQTLLNIHTEFPKTIPEPNIGRFNNFRWGSDKAVAYLDFHSAENVVHWLFEQEIVNELEPKEEKNWFLFKTIRRKRINGYVCSSTQNEQRASYTITIIGVSIFLTELMLFFLNQIFFLFSIYLFGLFILLVSGFILRNKKLCKILLKTEACPRCGDVFILKWNRYNKTEFWGHREYRGDGLCDNTMNVTES